MKNPIRIALISAALNCVSASAQQAVIQYDRHGNPIKVRQLESELSVVKIKIHLGENRAPAAFLEPEHQGPSAPAKSLPDALMSAAQAIPAQ